MRLLLSLCLALLLPSAVHAEWLEASSVHFVVYADDTERDIRRFTEQLERYHAAMAKVTGSEVPPPSPSNRVTVFVVKNVREVQRLFGEGGRSVGGFYIARAGSAVAIVPQVRVGSGQVDSSMNTLLHEYAHHFLISNTVFPAPRWLGEGGAEFFASVRFQSDGGLNMGLPSKDNYYQLVYADEITAEELFDPELLAKRPGAQFTSFYGKSWALYHYLTFDPGREGQLVRYLALMTQGKSSREAAQEAFGNFARLDRDVERYLRQPSFRYFPFKADELETGNIDVRRLSEGDVAIMPVRMRSRVGVDEKLAAETVLEARAVAARFPGVASVQAALAEAEYDAGNDAEAIAAADAALALDQGQVNAYVQKGYALFRRAAEAEDIEAAYTEAVAPFLALNRIEPDHPLPLVYYHRSFLERGRVPTENAVLGLERAAEVAPFDLDLRMTLARQQISDGRLDWARVNLAPVAFAPHPSPLAEGARAAIEHIDAGGGDTEILLGLLKPAPAEEAAGAGG